MRKPLSAYHPILYWLRVQQRRLFRRLSWQFSHRSYTKQHANTRLDFRLMKHTSKLIRKLGNSDLQLQINKITNLKIAASCLHGILIPPQHYFSFCQTVGKPTAKRGFLEGMELSQGEARQGIGGGICQLSNMIHWMALHSPLKVVERANHSFDPFPDDGRVLPFGSGAAIFYNYVDLVLYNPTQSTFQLWFHVGEKQLEGELLTNTKPERNYHVYQKEEQFVQRGTDIYRQNTIWRTIHTKGQQAELLEDQLLYRNCVIVKYAVPPEKIQQEVSSA